MKRALKVAGGAALTAAGALAAYLLLVDAPLRELDEAERRHASLRDEYVRRSRDAANLDILREQLAQMRALLRQARTLLPEADGLEVRAEPVEASLRAAAAEHRVARSLRVSSHPSQPREFYGFRLFQVAVVGDFRSLAGFLQRVSSGADEVRMVVWSRVEPVPKRPGQLVLFANLYAFAHYDDEIVDRLRKESTRK